MIIPLHTKSRLVPQEISKELAKIDVKISTSKIENLLVEYDKYAGSSRANGGTTSSQPQNPPQTPPQNPPQNPPQGSPQPASQPVPGDTSHGDMPPRWRNQS
jgi:hypothetical protein